MLIGRRCFQYTRIESFGFESESHLETIDEDGFSFSSLGSLFIPRSVTSIGPGCFDYSQIRMMAFESELQVQSFPRRSFSNCSITTIYIPASVERLGAECFARDHRPRHLRPRFTSAEHSGPLFSGWFRKVSLHSCFGGFH